MTAQSAPAGRRNSPGTFGTFLWVDQVAGAACIVLTDRVLAELL